MKATLNEFDGCFSIELVAENLDEAAKIVRLGVNRTKVLRHCSAQAYGDGAFHGSVVIGKSRSARSYLPPRKKG